jgi:hypothetical protein
MTIDLAPTPNLDTPAVYDSILHRALNAALDGPTPAEPGMNLADRRDFTMQVEKSRRNPQKQKCAATRPCAVALFLALSAPSAHAAVFVVNVPFDLGDSYLLDGICDISGNPSTNPPIPYANMCTLRAAIQQANFTPGNHTIEIVSPPIMITSQLPVINKPTVIRSGMTTFATIQWAGAGPSGDALVLAGGSSTVQALSIIGFTGGAAISIRAPGGNMILGNRLGVDANGAAAPNQDGIDIIDSPNNVIGGVGTSTRNVISANTAHGIYIQGANSLANTIIGNFIGTDPSGTKPLGNKQVGIFSNGASTSIIGGATTAEGNLIADNAGGGVIISGGSSTKILGNSIGTERAVGLKLGNGTVGVFIHNSNGNSIGAPAPGPATTIGVSSATTVASAILPNSGLPPGNLISNNDGVGIMIDGDASVGNHVEGNIVGLDATGLIAQGNAKDGISLSGAARNFIGGTALGAGNLVSSNGSCGVRVWGAKAVLNSIQGNWIGVDSTGKAARANMGIGVFIDGASSTTLGGATDSARNLISGNGQPAFSGVYIRGATGFGNKVQGNIIGMDRDGVTPLPNSGHGVTIDNATGNVVGGANIPASKTFPRNLISGNTMPGVVVLGSSSTGNVIVGNYIGPDATGGLSAVPAPPFGQTVGVWISDASANFIGRNANEGNVISNNQKSGVLISGASAKMNLVYGNFIGVDQSGAAPLPNGEAGVAIVDASKNLIGAQTATVGQLPGNVISANLAKHKGGAVNIQGSSATGNSVRGNLIGLAADGKTPLPNEVDGVFIALNASNNNIGGPGAQAGNTIAFNKRIGVGVDSGVGTANSTGNAILSNLIYSNGSLGIDLNMDGVSPSPKRIWVAPFPPMAGPNNWQASPFIHLRNGAPPIGTLDSTPNRTFLVEFFSSPIGDVSGYGQGQKRLGNPLTISTDKNGFSSFDVPAAPQGEVISATATDLNSNNTSEFSKLACDDNLLPDSNLSLAVSWSDHGTPPQASVPGFKPVLPVKYVPHGPVFVEVQLTNSNPNPPPDEDLTKAFVTVTVRNLFPFTQLKGGVVYDGVQPLDKTGKGDLIIDIDAVLKALAAGENKNLVEASVKVCYRGKTQASATTNLLNVLREKLIVFLPGVLGSKITVQGSTSPDFPPSYPFPPANSSVANLAFDPTTLTPKNQAVALSLFDEYRVPYLGVKLATIYDIDTPLHVAINQQLPDLTVAGRKLTYYDAVPWPYDWRLKLEDHVAALASKPAGPNPPFTSPPLSDLINAAKAQHPYLADKVALAGHSTGGLIVRSALTPTPPGLPSGQNFRQWVDRAFFINTPFLGAPKAYYALMTGDMVAGLLDRDILKQIAPDLPIVYYLAPIAGYIDPSNTNGGDLVMQYPTGPAKTFSSTRASPAATYMTPGIKAAQQGSPPAPPPGPWNTALAKAADDFFQNIGTSAPVIGWENTVVFAGTLPLGMPCPTDPKPPNPSGTTPGTVVVVGPGSVIAKCTEGDGTVPLQSLVGGIPPKTPAGYQPRTVGGIPQYVVLKNPNLPQSIGIIGVPPPPPAAAGGPPPPPPVQIKEEELVHDQAANLQPVWDTIVKELSAPEEANFSGYVARMQVPTSTAYPPGTSSQTIGEAETAAMVNSTFHYASLLDPTVKRGFKQGFDGLYCDGSLVPKLYQARELVYYVCDGTIVIAEAKGGYSGKTLEDILALGYDYRQGTIEWARKAAECELDKNCWSKLPFVTVGPDPDQVYGAQIVLDALEHGAPVRIEVFHADFPAKLTKHYVSASFPP